MARIALHGLHEIRDQVLTLFQLDIHVREGLIDPLTLHHKAVVDQNDKASDRDDCGQNY